MKKGLSFGQATEAMNDGQRVIREALADTGCFLFRQVPAVIPLETIPKMTSLPDKVKLEFVSRGKEISYRDQVAMVSPDNTIRAYAPTIADVFATDWCILD